VIALIALGVAVLVAGIVSGLDHGYLIEAWLFVLGAPLWWMLLGWFSGWVWLALYLLVFALLILMWPFRPLRESRFMHSLEESQLMQHAERWKR
jgi:hypothetical protein